MRTDIQCRGNIIARPTEGAEPRVPSKSVHPHAAVARLRSASIFSYSLSLSPSPRLSFILRALSAPYDAENATFRSIDTAAPRALRPGLCTTQRLHMRGLVIRKTTPGTLSNMCLRRCGRGNTPHKHSIKPKTPPAPATPSISSPG